MAGIVRFRPVSFPTTAQQRRAEYDQQDALQRRIRDRRELRCLVQDSAAGQDRRDQDSVEIK